MIIDGKKIAQNLRDKIKKKTINLRRKPGLAVILVGNDPASKIYVDNKQKACKEVGFYSEKIILNQEINEEKLLQIIDKLNYNDKIDGILVQLPLPQQIDQHKIINAINPNKDVDGFHSQNIGKLMQNKAFLRPATPKGIMSILANIRVDLVGKNCVIVGASNIVGRPMAFELLNARATITVCNSKTKNLKQFIKNADILVVGIGICQMVKGDWLKNKAIVIDVGINRLANGKLVGDVDFESAKNIASFITPVPGGVGPMTIASLLENTLIAYENKK